MHAQVKSHPLLNWPPFKKACEHFKVAGYEFTNKKKKKKSDHPLLKFLIELVFLILF